MPNAPASNCTPAGANPRARPEPRSGADIDDLDVNRGHRSLFIHRKGHKTATVPLSPGTARALDLYIGERESGPIFLGHDGTHRLDRHATYIVSTFVAGASR